MDEYWVTPANQPPYDHYIDFSHASAWTYLAEGNCSANDVLGLIVRDGYEAVSENPTCEIYADISKRVPDAKVILMGRDSKEKFETSWKTWLNTMDVTEELFRWSFPSSVRLDFNRLPSIEEQNTLPH